LALCSAEVSLASSLTTMPGTSQVRGGASGAASAGFALAALSPAAPPSGAALRFLWRAASLAASSASASACSFASEMPRVPSGSCGHVRASALALRSSCRVTQAHAPFRAAVRSRA
jgi:hypothetical protein